MNPGEKKLRIVHADTDDIDNPLGGGQPVRTFQINRRLSCKHDIKVYTAVYNGSRDLTREGVLYERLGFNIKPFGLSPHLSFLALLGPKIALSDHDLVIEEFMPPVGFSMLPLWTSKPVISIVQWYFFEFWEKKYRLPFKKIMQFIAKKGHYKYFIVQTEAMGKEISRHIPNAVTKKIPCGINNRELLESPSYGDFAFFLGRLDIYQKGLDMLSEIWEKVTRSTKIPLVIAGDGPGRKILEETFAKAGISELITFTGKVSGNEKEKLLATCRFLVMPSREETFGLTALEAMAASKPVVVFNIDNLNEVVRPEWGEIAEQFDTDSFAKLTLNLWQNIDYCKAKGAKASSVAKGYLWNNLAEIQNNFYHSVIGNEV